MKRILFITFITTFTVSGENCDNLGILLYEDMACQPKTRNGSCPTSFECNSLTSPGKCVVQGTTYNQGEFIHKNSLELSCDFGCICRLARDKRPEISCGAQGSCAEWAGLPLSHPDCYYGYNLKNCCSNGPICPPFNDTTKCLVDGVEYKVGERFAPEDSCHVCICQKGWNGRYEAPYCRRSTCFAQKTNQKEVQQYCAPVYIKSETRREKSCCPKTWTCPDGSEIIRNGNKQSELTCKYGEKTLQLGDHFEKEITYLFRPLKIKCECKIPPLLTCNK